jgi:hypothetical protein
MCECVVLRLWGDLDDGPQGLALPVRYAHDDGAPRVSLDETEHPTSAELMRLQRAALVLTHGHAVPFVELDGVHAPEHNRMIREITLHALARGTSQRSTCTASPKSCSPVRERVWERWAER